MKYIIRTIWRLVVLLLGVGLAYAAAFIAFPYLDKRLPFFFALLAVYIGVAYFGLPALLRFWRVLIKPNHIPLYVTTRDGIPSDPVNIAIVARSKHHLIRSMKKAGWYTSDRATFRNSLHEGWAMLLNKPYSTAPFSTLYLFNRPFDVGFQIPYGKNGSPRHRHHVRFWELVEPRKKDHGHFRFWMRHFTRFIKRRKTIWIGAAIDDIHLGGIRWYNLQITHRTHSKHTRERDLIIKSLDEAGLVKYVSEAQAGEPFAMRSQQIGNSYVSDGRLKIVELN